MEDSGYNHGGRLLNNGGVSPEIPGRVANVADDGQNPATGGGSEKRRCGDDSPAKKESIGGVNLARKRLKKVKSALGRGAGVTVNSIWRVRCTRVTVHGA